MRRFVILCLLLFALAPASALAQGDSAAAADDLRLYLPPGWDFVSDGTTYPVQLARDNPRADLNIFRSTLSPDEAVRNPADLQTEVRGVIDDVLAGLPSAAVLTSTGYDQGERAVFVIEFVTDDTTSGLQVRHRFAGLLYRLIDGRQVLFTLWAKTADVDYPQVRPQLEEMQAEFVFMGDHADEVFAGDDPVLTYVIVVLVLIAGVSFVIRRQRRAQELKFSEDSHFWRCECGRTNTRRHEKCQRCGRPRPDDDTATG